MLQNFAQVRKWLVGSAIVLFAIVTISYWIAKLKVIPKLHKVPKQLGIDIQQTSDGFSLSKSEGGRTIYTIRASKAVQFKQGGHADLKQCAHRGVWQGNHDRYDQIYGDQFTYDPQSGDIKALAKSISICRVMPKVPRNPIRLRPTELKNPLHLVTRLADLQSEDGHRPHRRCGELSDASRPPARPRAPITTPSRTNCS